MKLTRFTLVLLLSLLISSDQGAFAQSKIQIGPYLGNGFRMLTGNDKFDLGFGYRMGIITRVPLNEMVSVTPSFTYARKGYNQLGFIVMENDEFYKQRLSYMDIIVPIKFQVGEVFTFQVGAQAGILLSGELSYKNYNESKVTRNIKSEIRPVDWGMVLGAGCQFKNGVGLELMVNPGFSTIYEGNPPLYFNSDDNSIFGEEFNGNNLLATFNIFYLFGYQKPPAKTN